MIDLSKYKDMFGKPKTGAHKYRFLHVAIVDVILTIIGAYLISWYFDCSFLPTLGLLFLLGIILHRLFSVRTTLDKVIFPNINE
jgi:uncharacterized membrane protein